MIISRRTFGWLSLDSLVKYCALGVMYYHYTKCDCVVFNPPIQFGYNHSHNTQTPSYFCCISHCKTSILLDQEFSADWRNSLPSSLFDASQRTDFSWSLYSHLLDFCNSVMYFVCTILYYCYCILYVLVLCMSVSS